jgi:4-amino-4-deoxy-L-arabinose transferase-like glycosyltransferase
MNKAQKHELLILITLIALSVLGGMMYFGTFLTDSSAHFLLYYTIEEQEFVYIYDDVDITPLGVFTRPIAVLPVFLLTPFLDITSAWATMNLIYYILTTIVLYFTLKRLFNQRVAFIASVLCAVSLPPIAWATRIGTDVHGYFFTILGIYLIELLLDKDKFHSYLIIASYIGITSLIRENVFVLYPYLAIAIIYRHRWDIKKYIYNLWKYSIILLSFIPSHLWNYYVGGASLAKSRMKWFVEESISIPGVISAIPRTIVTFHLCWFYFFIGILAEKTQKQKEFYVKMLISGGLFVVLSYFVSHYSPRAVFIIFPAILAASAVGIVVLSKKCSRYFFKCSTWIVIFIVLYAILSYIGVFLYPESTDVGLTGGLFKAVWKEILLKFGM